MKSLFDFLFVKPQQEARATDFLSKLKSSCSSQPQMNKEEREEFHRQERETDFLLNLPALEQLFKVADTLIPPARKTPTFEVLPDYTPDYENLWDARGWPFFEYGQFKEGFPMSKRMDATYLCPAHTVHRCPLWTKNQSEDTFPVGTNCHVDGLAFPRAKIAGELNLVPTQNIPYLDTFYRNGVEFERKTVKILIPAVNDAGEPAELRAFMYVGKKDFWRPIIDWNMNFYRGREGAPISRIKPDRTAMAWVNWSNNFTEKDFRESNSECFTYFHDGHKKLIHNAYEEHKHAG